MTPLRFMMASGLTAFLGLMIGGAFESRPVYAQADWQTIEIKAEEYSFTPRRIQVKANRPLELVIENEGHEPHQFRSELFRDQTIEVEIDESAVRGRNIDVVDIAAGKTARIKLLSPPAGQFDFQCRIPSHHGMDGIIQIDADPSPTP
ncbi:MAG TPA: cupredoxin domain-containing protein [Nitrospiria bacterium]|nr:cupredoxin domain-containing protein [Nitrospiria bacterium]